jgi:hypothetical protein
MQTITSAMNLSYVTLTVQISLSKSKVIIPEIHTKLPSGIPKLTVEPVSAVSVIRGLPQPENINTFTAKVDHGRFQYLRFNLPTLTLVDLKFTLRFYIQGSLLSAVLGIRGRSWNISHADTGGLLYS